MWFPMGSGKLKFVDVLKKELLQLSFFVLSLECFKKNDFIKRKGYVLIYLQLPLQTSDC